MASNEDVGEINPVIDHYSFDYLGLSVIVVKIQMMMESKCRHGEGCTTGSQIIDAPAEFSNEFAEIVRSNVHFVMD